MKPDCPAKYMVKDIPLLVDIAARLIWRGEKPL